MKAGEVLAQKYRLGKRLGIGGMGEVWSAIHTGTGREFAIKLMHSTASMTSRERFAREARASSKINHPSVIDVFDVGETDDGSLYMAMELLDGLTLDDVLHAKSPVSVADFVTIMVDVVRALSAAHAVGVVHRDIKPANIFLHRDRATGIYSPKVLDFGISKIAGNEAVTRIGAVVGSPRYMSPEQTRSSATVDFRSDLWSLGVVLFEGLTGTFPHEGESFSSLVVAICTVAPKSIDQMAPHLPEALRAIVRDCLKPVDARVSSADQLAARLEGVLQDPNLSRILLPPAQHPAADAVKTVSALRIRPATTTGTYPATPNTSSGTYPAAGPVSTSGTYPAVSPASTQPSSQASPVFIPTAQTLPLSAVMALQEQLQEHLKAHDAKVRGGTLALPQAGSQASPRPLTSQPQPAPLATTMASTGPVPAFLSATQTSDQSSQFGPALVPAPPHASSGTKLRILLIVLTLVLIGIVIALVSTVRSS